LQQLELSILFGLDKFACRLPVKNIKAKIGSRGVHGGANGGAVDDAACVTGENAIGESVTNMFGKADEEAVVFSRLRGEVRIIDAKVNRFVPDESKECADVDGGTVEELEGNTVVERRSGHVVENEADVLSSKEPCVFWGTGAVENGIGDAFDVLPTSFREVLVLHVGLALPVGDREGAEDVFDA
jgi:hypothetical protein